MTRLLIWLTLIALVFAGSELVTAVDKINSHAGRQVSSGVANTGQTQTPPEATAVADAIPAPTDIATVQVPKQIEKTFEQNCEEALLPSKVRTIVQEPLVVHDYSKNIAALTTLSENTNALTLGLTLAQPQVKVVWDLSYLQEKGSGRVCMRPQFYIASAAGTQQVYVGREFPQGTCAFNEILKHELRHVETNKKIAELLADNLKQHIVASIENRVFYGKNKAEVEGYIVDAVQNHWMPLVKIQFENHKKLHHAIDTREEYLRIHNSCSGEVPAVLEQLAMGAR